MTAQFQKKLTAIFLILTFATMITALKSVYEKLYQGVKNPSLKSIVIFASILFCLKLVFLYFSQTVDADAVSRSQLSQRWLDNPVFITEGIWAPFHFYLGGAALWIHPNIVITLKIVSIIFSCLTLFPLFKFLEREFNANKAFYGVLIFSLSPIVFRTSLMFLSEVPFLFLVALTLNSLSKGIKTTQLNYFVYAGLFLSLASGFRMEALALSFIFSVAVLINSNWRNAMVFAFFSSIFSALWMYGNYHAHQNIFYSVEAIQNLAVTDLEGVLRKVWSFPFLLLIAIGPILFISLCINLTNWKRVYANPWVFSFVLFFIIILYKSLSGTIIPHARFICLITMLALPVILVDNKYIIKTLQKRWIFPTILTSTILLTFLYNVDNITPLPRLKDQTTVAIVDRIKRDLVENTEIFIDFVDWETTYYISLHTCTANNNQFLLDGYKNDEESFNLFLEYLDSSKTQFWILKPNHINWIENNKNFSIIFSTDTLIFLKSKPD